MTVDRASERATRPRQGVQRRLAWRKAVVIDTVAETASARTLVLDVDDWSGHVAGQHVDVRLTAEDA